MKSAAQHMDGDVLTTGSVSQPQQCVMETLTVMMDPMRWSVRTGTAVMDSGNVLKVHAVLTIGGCVMELQHAKMHQMSGQKHVRTGTALKAGGNVLMIQSTSLTQKCVMACLVVVMDQMSGLRSVRTGTALKAGGNVPINQSVSQSQLCVMETPPSCAHVGVRMDQMSGL